MRGTHTIYGIIGYPLEHSLSPVMHNAAFKELGVDAVYNLFPLKEEEMDDFFQGLRNEDSPIFGLNVTVPYKEKAIHYVDSLTPLAEKIGAINTIVINKQRKLFGYNTDAPGFMSHLAELQFNLKGKHIAMLGAGGSARAILTTLCMIPDHPQTIKIYNRTYERLETLLADLSTRVDVAIVEPATSIDDLDIEVCDLLINTTSLGMKPSDPGLVDEALLHVDLLVYDLVYNPKETPLLKMAKAKGAKTVNGLGMLFYQGVLALEHWANMRLEDHVKIAMRQALEKVVK